MNAFRKYAPWIIGIAMAAFIIPSTTSSFFKEKDDSNSSVKQPPKQYEPPFRMDGTLWAINDSDTTAIFRTEYANTPETIEYGMMYRRTMDKDMAMLFFMSGGDQLRSFWMKNTIVPLDIIYINSKNEVVSIQANAEPYSEKSLPSGTPASYVLEIYGGEAAAQGIGVGTKVYWSDKK